MSEKTTPILFLAYANDRVNPDNYLRDLVDEIRQIRRTLETRVVPPYRVVIRPNATLTDILEVFDQYEGQVRIFHYAGHADSLQLMLESAEGKVAGVGRNGFTRLLASQVGLRLVFLNGCATEVHAREMVAAGIPAVIATDGLVSDQAANIFASRFYERLGDQKTITAAFRDAEIKVRTMMVQGDNFRSLYYKNKARDSFPWILVGKQLNWRLNLSPRSGGGSIVHLLCDRYKQVEVFRDNLESILADTAHLPHFFVVHGARTEKHRSLIQRLKEVDISYNSERLFGKEMGIVHFHEVRDWPQTGDLAMRQRNLKRAIARAINLPDLTGTQWDVSELIKKQKLRGGMVVFQHTLNGERWDNTSIRLVKWYVEEFWSFTFEKELPQFIIFLNIIYPEERKNFISRLIGLSSQRQNIQRQLYQLADQTDERFTLLRELKPIPYTDVVEWVDEYYPEELADLPEILYGNNSRRRLPMEIIERELKKEVKRIKHAQALKEIYGEQ